MLYFDLLLTLSVCYLMANRKHTAGLPELLPVGWKSKAHAKSSIKKKEDNPLWFYNDEQL